jgi:hypothetical protein
MMFSLGLHERASWVHCWDHIVSWIQENILDHIMGGDEGLE